MNTIEQRLSNMVAHVNEVTHCKIEYHIAKLNVALHNRLYGDIIVRRYPNVWHILDVWEVVRTIRIHDDNYKILPYSKEYLRNEVFKFWRSLINVQIMHETELNTVDETHRSSVNDKAPGVIAAREFAIRAHSLANDLYDGRPYSFHLEMVVAVAHRYIPLYKMDHVRSTIYACCWLHDCIENARCTYSQILSNYGEIVAEVVRAVTVDVRGRNRRERLSDDCFVDMRRTLYATFIKLCDRIANVKYSIESGDRFGKLDMYRREHDRFSGKLRTFEYKEMWDELDCMIEKEPAKMRLAE